MSFSSEVKEEVKKKCFTFKNKHSKITKEVSLEFKKEYLMALFVKSGSISDPEKFYHLEFICECIEEADMLAELIAEFGISAKMVERKGHYIVYLKESDAISDMLGILGAYESMMKFENIRILKEMRENIQRQVNCETANLQKTVSASVRQIQDIEYIRERIGFDELQENLREIAVLRLEKPSATLKELSESLSTPLGKSGVNHRLRKLSNIADDLRKADGLI